MSVQAQTFVETRAPYLVSRRHPSSLLDQPRGVFVNFWRSSGHLVDRGLLPRSCALDVAQGLLQASQFDLDLALCLLSVLQRNLLEALDGLDLLAHIVRLGLECLEVLLNLVDDGRVFEDGAVVSEVDRHRLILQMEHQAAGVVIALLEVGQRCRRAAAETELGADFAPVELQRRAGLSRRSG